MKEEALILMILIYQTKQTMLLLLFPFSSLEEDGMNNLSNALLKRVQDKWKKKLISQANLSIHGTDTRSCHLT